MKKRKCFSHGWCYLLAVGVLAACSSSKSDHQTNTNFTYVYQTDPETWTIPCQVRF